MPEQKQAVVDDKADENAARSSEAKAGAHDDGDDLEKLLSEYDEANGGEGSDDKKPEKASPKSSPEQKPEKTGELYDMVKSIVDRDNKRETERQQEKFDADMKETVKAVRGEIPAKMASDRLVRAWIDSYAEDNPNLAQAWVNRHKDPKRFAKVVGALGKEFAKEFNRQPDPETTQDKALVADAVRGASTKAPDGKAPEYKSMTDAEFAADTEKKFGFRPKV
jgi:hypothetical protein